mgnify:CR=1 FL=1
MLKLTHCADNCVSLQLIIAIHCILNYKVNIL